MTNTKEQSNKVKVMTIQVEMGFILMTVMAKANMDTESEQAALQALSAMQLATVTLLNLTQDELELAWRSAHVPFPGAGKMMSPKDVKDALTGQMGEA